MNESPTKKMSWLWVLLGVALLAGICPQLAAAQDQDDPPARVARLGYMQGAVSFQPAGESDWVQAVSNRPMTTGDQLWADQDSRAEVELGSAVIRLAANTGFSFLNLDDRTVQIQLTSGSLNITVRSLNRDDEFEVDTPNQAFSIFQRGRYRVEASEDGTYTVVSVRDGEGESTGNGQTYTLRAGQRVTFSGTESLNAEALEIAAPDEFDNWAYGRDNRHQQSRSAQYLSQDVVGYEDLDDYGDWRDDSNYGHVWFPNRVSAGWAPYREGHWDWISPWGWTWVDDASWGYAPFHYGRWVNIGERWGWVAGPANVVPVYAPALVVFMGAGGGGNVGWFPLGPREVYVPSYNVSRGYVNRVNISNTTVNQTTITNVYNTTIVNKTTNITNVTYVNRQVVGAITAVPQRTFVSAQAVGKAAVAVNARELASAPLSSRAAVAPSRESVLGSKANSVGRAAAPPAALAIRQVVAKATPPPPPVAFARQQQGLAAHPGQPLARQEVQSLRPANAPAARPMIKQAPAGKPATPIVGRPGTPSNAVKPGQPPNIPPSNQPSKPVGNESPAANPGRPNNASQPNRSPSAAPNRPEGNRPEPNQPAPNNRPETNRPPTMPPNNRPEVNRPPTTPLNNRPETNRPPPPNNRPEGNPPEPKQPVPNDRPEANRPPTAPPNNRPEANRPPTMPPNNRPETNRPPTMPPNNRPDGNRPESNQPAPNNRPETNRPPTVPPNNRPEGNRPEPNPPTPSDRSAPNRNEGARPPTPEEKKKQDEQRKQDDKSKPPQTAVLKNGIPRC
jgi:hypothetical protein